MTEKIEPYNSWEPPKDVRDKIDEIIEKNKIVIPEKLHYMMLELSTYIMQEREGKVVQTIKAELMGAAGPQPLTIRIPEKRRPFSVPKDTILKKVEFVDESMEYGTRIGICIKHEIDGELRRLSISFDIGPFDMQIATSEVQRILYKLSVAHMQERKAND